MIIEYLVIPVLSYLNRIRGGGFWADKIPGRPLLWVFPVVLAIAILLQGYVIGTGFALLYLSWAFPPWGRWFTLNHIPPVREITIFERIVEFIPSLFMKKSYWFDFICFTIRNIITLSPLVLLYFLSYNLLGLIAIVIGVSILIVMCYSIGWKIQDKYSLLSIQTAELLVGAFWGGLLLLVQSLKLMLYI